MTPLVLLLATVLGACAPRETAAPRPETGPAAGLASPSAQ